MTRMIEQPMTPEEVKNWRIMIAIWEYQGWIKRGNKQRAEQALIRLNRIKGGENK